MEGRNKDKMLGNAQLEMGKRNRKPKLKKEGVGRTEEERRTVP